MTRKLYKNMNKNERTNRWIKSGYFWLDKNEIELAEISFSMAKSIIN